MHSQCVAMNRSLTNVLFGGIGASAGGPETERKMEGSVIPATVDDAVEALVNAGSVVITPGYGLAVAKAQFEISEITKLLRARGVNVRFGVHPVAGMSLQLALYALALIQMNLLRTHARSTQRSAGRGFRSL